MGREDYLRLLLLAVTVVVFAWLAATSQIQGQILGVVFLALVVWSLYPGRHLESSVLVIALLSLFQASLSLGEFIDSLFSTYGSSGLWIIISGFILAEGMRVSGLGRRVALWIATSMGGRPRRIILAVAVANLAVAPLSPSTTAKAFLLLPIVLGLVEAFDVEKGGSRYGAAVMLMAMAANNICSTAFLTSTVPNPISADYIRQVTGVDLDWFGWLRMGLPMSLALLGLSWALCLWMFPPEVRESQESLERIKKLKEGLGPLTRGEVLVAALFSVALALWITEGYNPYNAGLISLALTLVLFVPRVGVMRLGGFAGSVPWGSIALFAASMFLAKAVGRWQALNPVAMAFFDLLNLESLTPLLFVTLIVLASMYLHIGFTSTTVYATVMMPLVISLTRLQGLPVEIVALPVAFLAPVAVILPVNTIPNIVFYGAGYFSQRQMVAYGMVLSLVSALMVLLLGMPYWRLLGLV